MDVGTYDLLIFDLDGTLVNSEYMTQRLIAASVLEITGDTIDIQALAQQFRGRTFADVVESWCHKYGEKTAQSIREVFSQRYWQATQKELMASAGALETVAALSHLPMCVASNGGRRGIRRSLECTGLDKYFNNIFSIEDVKVGKPAPDLFLHAAKTMGVEPQKCLVIEDSLHGVKAALAAEMTVIAYTGNHPDTTGELSLLSSTVISHMRELPPLVLS